MIHSSFEQPEVGQETLMQGWNFNIDQNYRLYREGFGNIFLPANTARE